MATITVTIPNPILSGSDHFVVSYKLASSSTWILFGNETNSPFNITGLANGDYEIKYQLVSGGIASDCITEDCFTLSDTCACPAFSNAKWQTVNSVSYISLDIDFTGVIFPPCGMSFNITDGFGNFIANTGVTALSQLYPTSPVTNVFQWRFLWFLGAGSVAIVQPSIDCCLTNNTGGVATTQCETFKMTEGNPVPTPCAIPIQVVGNQSFAYFSPSANQWYINIQVVNATPPCGSITIHYAETYVSGGTPDSGTVVYTSLIAGLNTVIIPVSPNTAHDYGKLLYNGYIIDCCDSQHHNF